RWPRDWSSDVCSSDLALLLSRSGPRQLAAASVAEFRGSAHRITLNLAGEGDLENCAAVRHRPVNREAVAVEASLERELAIFVGRSEERRVGRECREGC